MHSKLVLLSLLGFSLHALSAPAAEPFGHGGDKTTETSDGTKSAPSSSSGSPMPSFTGGHPHPHHPGGGPGGYMGEHNKRNAEAQPFGPGFGGGDSWSEEEKYSGDWPHGPMESPGFVKHGHGKSKDSSKFSMLDKSEDNTEKFADTTKHESASGSKTSGGASTSSPSPFSSLTVKRDAHGGGGWGGGHGGWDKGGGMEEYADKESFPHGPMESPGSMMGKFSKFRDFADKSMDKSSDKLSTSDYSDTEGSSGTTSSSGTATSPSPSPIATGGYKRGVDFGA